MTQTVFYLNKLFFYLFSSEADKKPLSFKPSHVLGSKANTQHICDVILICLDRRCLKSVWWRCSVEGPPWAPPLSLTGSFFMSVMIMSSLSDDCEEERDRCVCVCVCLIAQLVKGRERQTRHQLSLSWLCSKANSAIRGEKRDKGK